MDEPKSYAALALSSMALHPSHEMAGASSLRYFQGANERLGSPVVGCFLKSHRVLGEGPLSAKRVVDNRNRKASMMVYSPFGKVENASTAPWWVVS